MRGVARQGGFTLLELSIAMMVAALLLVATLPDYRSEINTRLGRLTADEMWQLAEAAQLFHADNGAWPDEVNNCAGAFGVLQASGHLPASAQPVSSWDNATAYVTACPPTGGPGSPRNFRVSLNMGGANVEWAQQVAGELANGQASAFGVVSTEVPRLAALAGLDALLPRDGSRPMTGNLDMGGNDIVNAGDVTAAGTVSAGVELVAPRLTDADNPARVVDPSGTSELARVNVDDVCLRNPLVPGRERCLSESVLMMDVRSNGDLVPKPACPAGAPRIYVSTMMFSPDGTGQPIGAVQSYAVDLGASWQVRLRVLTPSGFMSPSPTYGKVMVAVKCD